jgi:hypothetical protein
MRAEAGLYSAKNFLRRSSTLRSKPWATDEMQKHDAQMRLNKYLYMGIVF